MTNSGETAVRGRPFPKGVSGNPNGRPPKEWTWRSLLLEAAEELEEDDKGDTKQVKAFIARALTRKAMEGDVSAIKEFGDRIDGKAKQGIEMTGEGGGPIQQSITVKFE